GTYVGTIVTNGLSQVDFKMGSAAAGGGEAVIGVWNTYNRVTIENLIQDTTTTWVYNTNVWRATNGSSTNRVSAVAGLREDPFSAHNQQSAYNSTGYSQFAAGVCLDAANSLNGTTAWGWSVSSSGYGVSLGTFATMIFGFHFFQAVENATFVPSGSNVFYGSPVHGLSYQWRH
ncbi:MAG: hypothetical protein AAB403_13975, partial [Planctomycetota bacterium]